MERHQELSLAGDVPQETERAGAHQRAIAGENQQLARDPPAQGILDSGLRTLALGSPRLDPEHHVEECWRESTP